MRRLFSSLLLLGLCPALTLAEGESDARAPQPPAPATAEPEARTPEAELAELCELFDGTAALQRIQKILEDGADVNEADQNGQTPLLLLCQSLELDYRYRTEPHYSKAVNEAVELLLRNNADTLTEDKNGCNAMFYLHGKPQLLHELAQKKLVPPELAVRIPHDEAALLRYMRLRVAQAGKTENRGSRAYLIRRYCTPAYERAEKLLRKYLSAEMRRRIPPSALEDTLAFLHLANPLEVEAYINALPLWKHGEHFLEEVPEYLLQTLHMLQWKVDPAMLREALDLLDSMLPKNKSEIIDCNAGFPMGLLLEMLIDQQPADAAELLERFSESRDNHLAYTALCLRLQEKRLPLPEPEAIAAGMLDDEASQAPQGTKQRIWECTVVDAAIRLGEIAALDADQVRRTQLAMQDMGMPAHAAVLANIVDEEGLAIGEESMLRVSEEYNHLSAIAPRVVLARYILGHPEYFRTTEP